MNTPLLDQINIVSTDLEASVTFYRRLGLAIPEQRLWRTATGLHHVSAETPTASAAIHLIWTAADLRPSGTAGGRATGRCKVAW